MSMWRNVPKWEAWHEAKSAAGGVFGSSIILVSHSEMSLNGRPARGEQLRQIDRVVLATDVRGVAVTAGWQDVWNHKLLAVRAIAIGID